MSSELIEGMNQLEIKTQIVTERESNRTQHMPYKLIIGPCPHCHFVSKVWLARALSRQKVMNIHKEINTAHTSIAEADIMLKL